MAHGDNVQRAAAFSRPLRRQLRRLAAIPRPSPGESMLRLVVHSIAGRRQSEQRSPKALSHRCACCAAHSLPHIIGLACAGSVETCQNGRFDFGTYQTRLQSSWQAAFHRRLAPNVLLLATASSQGNLRACAPARRGAAAYGSASWRLAEGLILETPLDSVITP